MARYRERCTAEGARSAERERKMDGEAYRRDPGGAEGSEDVRISLKRWVGNCMRGHIERVMAHVAQTGAMVTVTD